MSNYLAVATVSAVLRSLITAAAQAALPGVSTMVDTDRPDSLEPADGAAAISIFLYRVSPNPTWRNEDLPTRRGNGQLIRLPQAALDLHYLLTFFGEENLQQPERLLGGVVSALHTEPILSRERIEQVLTAEAHLADSDLAEQVDLVRFSPQELSVEEMSNLWSGFPQTNYRLSVAYRGSVVLISPEDQEPRPTLPVQLRNLYVETFQQPVVESVEPAAGPRAPILPGDELVLRGHKLRGEDTLVAIGGETGTPSLVREREVRIDLSEPPFPADTLRAGVLGVQVLHRRPMGTPPVPHVGVQSNITAFVLRPAILALPSPTNPITDYTVTVGPEVGRRQQAALLLNGTAGRHVIRAATRTEDSSTLEFDIAAVAPGEYLSRVQVDGAESVLEGVDTDADEQPDEFVGPILEVTAP